MIRFLIVLGLTFVLMSSQPVEAVSKRQKTLMSKANHAVALLREHMSDGDDVSKIIPKMKRVKTLGDAGKVDAVNALLDEILRDFKNLDNVKLEKENTAIFISNKAVNILGYDRDVMEAFISRDGQYMFFNDFHRYGRQKDIYYATRIDDYNFQFQNEVKNINTSDVDGVPTMDKDGNFFFISTHHYKPKNLVTSYQGKFVDGTIIDVKPLPEMSINKSGWLNMDMEISNDGQTLYSTQSHFKRGQNFPNASYFFYAKKTGDAFIPQKDSKVIFKEINKDKIVYGATISNDEREIMYTRLNIESKSFESMRATRPNKYSPFGKPERIKLITGFSEAPAITGDGKIIYYHKKDVKSGLFKLYALHRR